jgi:phosphoserine phosphatase RsbU/P
VQTEPHAGGPITPARRDDPWRLLSWANTALVERAGTSADFVTAACMTYLPRERVLRWAYAGHPPAVRLSDGAELVAPSQGVPLGVHAEPEYAEGTFRAAGPTGILLYTDGLTEARHKGTLFGLRGVTTVLGELENPSASEAVAALRTRVGQFADDGTVNDDLCMLAARID